MRAEDPRASPGGLGDARLTERLRRNGERVEIVEAWSLKPVGRRPPLPEYLRQLWRRRHFISADARARAFSRNRGMLLGNAWLVLTPLLDGIAYLIIFGLILDASRGMENYVAFLTIGIFMFSYTGRSLSSGASAITGGRNLIRGFAFPRASLPVAIITREAIGMLPVTATMLALILAIPPHAEITWRWTIFPLVFALQTAFNLGIAFIAARMAARIPDLQKVVGFIARFWRYGSAVMFSFDRFVSDERLLTVLELNPLFIALDMYRDILLYAAVPGLQSWLTLSAWAAGTLVVGFIFFWRGEERYGRD